MLHLDLSTEEQLVLRDVVDTALSELRSEISHTDSWEYRDLLKARRELLEKLQKTLSPLETIQP